MKPNAATNAFRVLLTNAFGLSNKSGELQHRLKAHDIDVAIITETKFSAETSLADFTFPGYSNPIRKDRDALGGGVAVWVKSSYAVQHLDNVPTADQEVVWLAIRVNKDEKVVLGAVYRSGSCRGTDTTLMEYLDDTIDNARAYGSNIMLAGDFNVHNTAWLGSQKTTVAGEALEEFAALHSLQQHVHEPTRARNTLDLILTDTQCSPTVQLHPPLGRSDHAVIVANFSTLVPPPTSTTKRKVWRYAAADWNRMKAHFRELDWTSVITDDPEESCNQLTDALLAAMDRFIPSKLLVTRPADPTWWTPECTAAVRAKDRCWKAWRRNLHAGHLKDDFLASVNIASIQLWRAREASERDIKAKLSAGSLRDKQWWSTIKRAAGESRATDIPTLVSREGVECHSSITKADCLAQHFADKCSLGDTDLRAADLPPVNLPHYPSLERVYFRPGDVRRRLGQLVVSKATGPDAIPARVLKECNAELATPLAKLFSLCFRRGLMPSSWKLAHVVPVHKRSSRSNPSNYRPVSLLSILSKVMEGIINRQLMTFFERNNVIPDSQYGFRSGRGTADVLTALQSEWVQAVASGGCAQVIAVDIAGAFDRVSHIGILHKAKAAGIDGSLLTWLADYLHHRRLKVVVGGQSSQARRIFAGVPQGSILGPTLFLLYVGDIDRCLTPGTKLSSFADDTTLYSIVRSITALPESARGLQAALSNLHEWGQRWRVRFEPAKSQRLVLSNHRKRLPTPDISFGNTPVPEAEQLKLLGVTFDSSLSFRQHIHNMAVRGNQRLSFLRRAAKVLDYEGRLTTYKGFVRPVLEYAPLVWMSATDTHLKRLDRVQKKAMRIIGPGTLLQSLSARRTVAGLSYLYKLHSVPGPPQLTAMVPPPAPLILNARTRTQLDRRARHNFQLQSPLPTNSPNYLQRSFPFCLIDVWNELPPDVLTNPPALVRLQTFKCHVQKFIQQRNWLAATDYVHY